MWQEDRENLAKSKSTENKTDVSLSRLTTVRLLFFTGRTDESESPLSGLRSALS